MFDRQLFLSHFGARQNGANNAQNFDKVVVDSQGVKWGFNQRKGIYENLNTGQRMNSILFENTNLSNAAAASDASSGWGVSNRSSDVNTPEIQALLTKKGSSRGKDFRRSDDVVSLAQQISIVATPESFFPLDAVFYGRIQGPYFDDTFQGSISGPGPQWRATGGKNKVYFNPNALLGSTYTNLDNPGSGHIEVQSFKTWSPSNSVTDSKIGIEVVFGTTSDAKTAWTMIWSSNTGAGGTAIYYAGTTGAWRDTVNISQLGDRGGRAVFYSRIATSGKTLAMMGGAPNEVFATDPTPESAFLFRNAETSPPSGAYASTWRSQVHNNGGGWFDYDAWVSVGQTGSTAELLSRTLFIPLGNAYGVINIPNYGHYPLSSVFSPVVNNGATGYNSILEPSPGTPIPVGNVPYANNYHNMLINNPNGAGSTTPFAIEFAFLKGTAGSTAGLISDWTSFYGITGNTGYTA